MSLMHNNDWPKTVAEAKKQQLELRAQVRCEAYTATPTLIGGTDVGFREGGTITRAVFVVLAYPSLALVEHAVCEAPTVFPYVPGYLSFRELPALLKAYQQLQQKPELVLCDGQGMAHPRRFGLACHLGVLLDLPTIGVAKSRLVGEYAEPGVDKGERSPLIDNNEQIGWVLRSRSKVKPVFVSPGHRTGLADSVEWVLHCCQKTKLPEPTRIADKLS